MNWRGGNMLVSVEPAIRRCHCTHCGLPIEKGEERIKLALEGSKYSIKIECMRLLLAKKGDTCQSSTSQRF